MVLVCHNKKMDDVFITNIGADASVRDFCEFGHKLSVSGDTCKNHIIVALTAFKSTLSHHSPISHINAYFKCSLSHRFITR